MKKKQTPLKEEKLYEDIRYELKDLKTVMLVGCYEGSREKKICEEHLEELASLSDTYGFTIYDKISCPLRKIDSSTYLGKGKLQELNALSNASECDVIIFDEEITPNQQKNLENLFKKPVIDRTELILEVFAKRAHSKEARLQIELAKTRYQLPRLKRLWTHLSRQAGTAGGGSGGGGGYLKGEGEKQIEIDKRILKKRIAFLQSQLKEVRAQRTMQRQGRLRSGIPIFAIVGYTNSGKSTLLNALTDANVLMEDKLFATLETTTRKFILPNHQEILLIDTVGFIRKIPHTLVESFKSTLEEALFTDILLHIVDVSSPLAEEQAEATFEVLKELGSEKKPTITVLNKIDQCEDKSMILRFRLKYTKTVMISASKKEGFDDLLEMIETEVKALRRVVTLKVPQSKYHIVSELMDKGQILESEYEGNNIILKVEIPQEIEHKISEFLVP
ncbi:GTPase HflX [Candidatus Aerophobetes bacterium]|uniref:GTPase HflX n=1 Tax=Aerophobetes bacterium TaxID=2030807 RepID=A0A2A4YG35_UNCAE|nr:MAG: GTPase HflX [Candidatus Aerophobetes bacterium]